MTKILSFALKIKGGGREGGKCKVLRPCHPPQNLKRASVQYYKNFQLVTLPKYSTPKSMTNLDTVSLNAKSFLQKDYIIPSCHKESK